MISWTWKLFLSTADDWVHVIFGEGCARGGSTNISNGTVSFDEEGGKGAEGARGGVFRFC